MPFPSDGCDPGELPDGCCNKLYEQGLQILDAALTQLEGCLGDSDCGCPLAAFVSLGPLGATGVVYGDVLAVTLDGSGLEISPGSVARNGVIAAAGPPSMRSVWRVTLQESGYPPVEDTPESVIFPTPAKLAAANLWAYAHGEAMYRGILGALLDRQIAGCDGFVITDLTPIPPSQTLEGWVAGFSMGLKLGFTF